MNRSVVSIAALTAVLLPGHVASAPEFPTQPFEYHEDFETNDPVQFWVSNGEYDVNFKGLTDEKAFVGRKSFKLDVTLKSATYCYWSVPVKAPCAGKLKFSGRISVAEAKNGRVGLGCNFVFPPTHHSGCGAFGAFDKATDEWQLQQQDLVAAGAGNADRVLRHNTSDVTGEHVVTFVDRWGIFLYGTEGSRVVVYVDDVRIEGEVPETQAYNAGAEKRFQPARETFQRRLTSWREELTAARRDIDALGELPPLAQRMKEVALKAAESAQADLDQFDKVSYASPTEISRLEASVKTVRYATPNLLDMSKPGVAERPFVTYVAKPMTNSQILPTSFPIVGRIASELSVTACAGEYEPATFAVRALKEVKGLTVTATDLKSGANVLPASAVDLSIVKCWFQAGVQIWDTRQCLLTPELLLKDDSLVRVDAEKKENYLRAGGGEDYVLISGKDSSHLTDIRPRDAEALQPVDIGADTTRQFWVTVHVPDDAAPGEYEGKIKLAPADAPAAELTLRLRVLPFKLEQSALCYSVYYRGVLKPDGQGSISSEAKSPEQYEAEMRDLKAHGVDHPTLYQGYDETLLEQAFDIRARAGLPTDTLYSLGLGTGSPAGAEDLERLRAGAKRWVELARRHGYGEVYGYGIDEATGEQLKAQRAAWQVVHEAGAKVFVACYKGTFEVMGDLLDLAVYAGAPLAEEAEKYHRAGHRIFCYANPQVGVEEPETYRRNFGLLLWKAGYDGAMDYAYQHSFNHGWNDFDDAQYRDHNFTYQTVNGVLDTLQWEGFREGVDDVRYVTTLVKALGQAKGAKPDLVKQAQAWLDDLDVAGDLDGVRAKMVEWILKLTQ
jgi:hypothetical protein